MAAFDSLQAEIFAAYGIEPDRDVSIRLVSGGADANTKLRFSEKEGWVAAVGTKSALSEGLLFYFDHTVRQQAEQARTSVEERRDGPQ